MQRLLGRVRPASASVSHVIRFLTYNFVGALLPLIISWTVRRLGEVPAPPGVYAPELLFFGVMISATALGDITDETKILGNAPSIQLIKGTLLFGAIGVAAIFGMYQYDAIIGSGNSAFRSNITDVTLIVVSVLFLASLTAEILIARIRGATP